MASSNQPLTEQLDELIELRPFPVTASRIATACQDENATASQIGAIISQDPALAMKLLNTANSPIYGHSGQIRSVQDATVVIGLRALKNLVLSAAVGEVFGNGDAATAQSREKLLEHSIACGSIARTLASVTGLGVPEEAFLGGMIHDVGKLFFSDHRPDEYSEILVKATTNTIVDTELQIFGIAHTSVGGECSRTWGLPDEISDVICFHHQPDESDFESELVNVVNAANRLTRLWQAEDAVDSCPSTKAVLKDLKVDLSPAEVLDLHSRAMTELNATRGVA